MKCLVRSIAMVVISVFIFSSYVFALVAAPPEQPVAGPGGSDYLHEGVISNGPYFAEGPGRPNNYKYYIYEPSDPMLTEAPVILFLHGWLAYSPDTYLSWIEHIARKGYIVVWVQYDAGLSLPSSFTDKAIVTWKDALALLDSWDDSHVQPEKDELGQIKTAITGHSMGGYLCAILAARAAEPINEIPIPHAIVLVEPAGLGIIPEEDLSAITSDTKLVIVVGENDHAVGSKSTPVAIWNGTPQIPNANRDFLCVQSDRYGWPWQIANHHFPTTGGRRGKVDARDFFVTYKLSVAAFNCAFGDTECEYALGNGGIEQVDMGEWSDGQPMQPMIWVENPNLLESTSQNR